LAQAACAGAVGDIAAMVTRPSRATAVAAATVAAAIATALLVVSRHRQRRRAKMKKIERLERSGTTSSTHMAGLHEGQLLPVMLFLAPDCALRVQVTSRTGLLARAAASDLLWAEQAIRVFGFTENSGRKGPKGEDCGGSWTRVFKLWAVAAKVAGIDIKAGAPGLVPLPARWVALWCRLRRWLVEHTPEVASTLRPALPPAMLAQMLMLQTIRDSQVAGGVSAAQTLIAAIHSAGSAITGMWQVCDGQNMPVDAELADVLQLPALRQSDMWSLGMFGGYTVYDHEVSTALLSMRAAIRLTQFLWARIPALSTEHKTKLAFACSCNLVKIFLVDATDGAVYVFTRQSQHLLERAVPMPIGGFSEGVNVCLYGLKDRPELNGLSGVLVRYVEDKCRWQVRMQDGWGVILLKQENLDPAPPGLQGSSVGAADGLMHWFEEFVHRLEGGMYKKQALKPERIDRQGICLFPVSGTEISRCVTRGVEVTASCIYMPEHPQGWTYSITFQLVCMSSERGFNTCQLHTRKWEIQEDGQNPRFVNGEGVVGFFPILADGGWVLNKESDPHGQYRDLEEGHVEGPFRYQSCAGRNASMKGFFGGELTFVPGTISRPTGPPFQVRLKPFRLQVPAYIY